MGIKDFGQSLARGLAGITPEQRAMLLRGAAAQTRNKVGAAGLMTQAQEIIALQEAEKEAARKQAIEAMRQEAMDARAQAAEEGKNNRFLLGQQGAWAREAERASAPTAWQRDTGAAIEIMTSPDAPDWLKKAAQKKLGIEDKDAPVWRQQFDESRRILRDPNASEGETAWATNFLYGKSTEFEIGPDGQVKFRSGGKSATSPTTARTTTLQGMVGTLESAKNQLDEIVSFYGQNKGKIPSWSYGAAGDLTQKVSGFFSQYSLPMASWVEGTLNPAEAQELRTRSIAVGTQLLPLFTGEEGRFTDPDRQIGYNAAQVMISPSATPASVAKAWDTVGKLLDSRLMETRMELLQDELDADPEIRQIQMQLLNDGMSWQEIKRITEGG